MPRNSSGTYSLPSGNPVVTGTTISSTWANTTLSDIGSALTDSLSRSGDGGMTAPLELAAGAVGAPGLSWSAETTSGLYRASTGNFRFSISSTDIITITSSGLAVSGTISASNFTGFANPSASIGLSAVNGSATTAMRSDASPALSQAIAPTWTGNHVFQPTSGVPFSGLRSGTDGLGAAATLLLGSAAKTVNDANVISLQMLNSSDATINYAFIGSTIVSATAGAESGTVDIYTRSSGSGPSLRAQWSPTGEYRGVSGSAAAPAVSFSGDTDSGIYLSGANEVSISAGGTAVLTLQAGLIQQNSGVFRFQDGSAASPSITFASDTDTGIYSYGTDALGFATNGVVRVVFDNVGAYLPDGAAATPSVAFLADTNTGIYRIGADQLGVSTGGTLRLTVSTTAVTSTLPILFPDGSVSVPSIAFSGDADLGFYRVSANVIGIALSGVNQSGGSIQQNVFTGTVTGLTTTEQGNFFYQRCGHFVAIYSKFEVSGTSNAATMTITGMPSALYPVEDVNVPGIVSCIDNGNVVQAHAYVSTTGVITLLKLAVSGSNITTTTWTNSGTKGIAVQFCIIYYAGGEDVT